MSVEDNHGTGGGRTRRFSGPTMSEVLVHVRREMGPDALILSSRGPHPSGGGVELTVAVGGDAEAALEHRQPLRSEPHRRGLWGARQTGDRAVVDEPIGRLLTAPLRQEKAARLRPIQRYETADEAGLRGKAISIIKGAPAHSARPPQAEQPVAAADVHCMARQLVELRQLMGQGRDWLAELIDDSGVSAAAAAALRDALHSLLGDAGAEQDRRQALHRAVRDLTGGRAIQQPSVMALVGPTGVGKTTTIAKLAAVARFGRGERVQLLCLDGFRVGAVGQLRDYAELLDTPLEVVSRPAELQQAIDRALHDDRADTVLIDTAGRNPGDAEQVPQLARAFSHHEVQVHLCLPVATRHQELSLVLHRFAQLKPDALLFTKLDEAIGLSGILNGVVEAQVGVSYVTHGQRVPEDLLAVDEDWLTRSVAQSLWSQWRGSTAQTVLGEVRTREVTAWSEAQR